MRQRLSWLATLPGPVLREPAAAGSRPCGRWRARLLARLHAILGDEPSLRLLNFVEYGFASLPRAAGTLRSAVLEPIEQVLPHIDVPVLVVRADQDRLSSLAWAERLASLPPDGRVARLPGLGHDAFHRAAATVAGTIAPFLDGPA
ncbi:MAG TPA: hypothetical protein VF070_24840 [Streptosporangiaceae bacterium]